MWYIHKIEHYSSIKSNEILIQATAWINLKNIMQNKRRQSHKTS